MKGLALKASAHLSAAVVVLFAVAPPAAAQDAFNKRDMRDRESALRIKAKTVRRPVAENPELALAEIREDYERVQVANNDIRRAAAAQPAPDYKRVAALGAEIKKRAARLKENLGFTAPAGEGDAGKNDAKARAATAPADEGARVKDSLSALDRHIVSFVTNPLFQSLDLKVDAALAARAARDLERIIALGSDIKRGAERLHKAHDKPGGP